MWLLMLLLFVIFYFVILLLGNSTFKTMIARLPNAKEMKNRNNGQKSQEILIDDQAQAALDICRFDQAKTVIR